MIKCTTAKANKTGSDWKKKGNLSTLKIAAESHEAQVYAITTMSQKTKVQWKEYINQPQKVTSGKQHNTISLNATDHCSS